MHLHCPSLLLAVLLSLVPSTLSGPQLTPEQIKELNDHQGRKFPGHEGEPIISSPTVSSTVESAQTAQTSVPANAQPLQRPDERRHVNERDNDHYGQNPAYVEGLAERDSSYQPSWAQEDSGAPGSKRADLPQRWNPLWGLGPEINPPTTSESLLPTPAESLLPTPVDKARAKRGPTSGGIPGWNPRYGLGPEIISTTLPTRTTLTTATAARTNASATPGSFGPRRRAPQSGGIPGWNSRASLGPEIDTSPPPLPLPRAKRSPPAPAKPKATTARGLVTPAPPRP